MWASAPPPIYSVDRASRRKAAKNASSSFPSPPPPPSPPASVAPVFTHTNNIAEFLEPAVDGPPSPETLRALSKQMRRASILEKHQSHQTTSSGSSSLRSLGSADRPSWEQALEANGTLSRRSSQRSTTSSLQPRDRPESVQIFGKTIFNRRGKLRRDSGAHSSSGSSLYSGEMPLEAGGQLPPQPQPQPQPQAQQAPSAGNRDTFIPAFFNRRRATKQDTIAEESEARRRFQISGPYNFQHLTHTPVEHISNLQRGSRMASDLSAMRATQSPTDGSLHFADFSSEALPLNEDEDGMMMNAFRPPPLLRQHVPPPGRMLQHTRSENQLRIPPPRPPRSPMEPSFAAPPPVPPVPPRISSRVSIRYDGYDPLASTSLERPQTSGGFRQPEPLALAADGANPPAVSHAHSYSADLDTTAERRYSRVISVAPDDANWPLSCPTTASFDTTLPDVPEEEEHLYMATKKSRVSVASNSSLRGSHSVPLLRQFSQSLGASSQRPGSGASDTLGPFDLFAAQRELREALDASERGSALPREAWEDDIDYCYDHEAEADCDYPWDRSSLDVSREAVLEMLQHHAQARASGNPRQGGVSPAMLSPGGYDVPALSPASQASATSTIELVTPTAPGTSPHNLPAPRSGRQHVQQLLHVRTPSQASSFKESHGFNLSPSFLIPGTEYHQQMIAHEADEFDGQDDGERYEGLTLNMETSALLIPSRTSASTTGSNDSSISRSSDRHISTASTATDLTRLTMSTASMASVEDILLKEEPALPPVEVQAQAQEPEPLHVRVKSEPMAMLLEEVPESPVLQRDPGRNSDTKLVRRVDEGVARLLKRKDSAHFRRQRARTASLSTRPAPGQYGLFPSIDTGSQRI